MPAPRIFSRRKFLFLLWTCALFFALSILGLNKSYPTSDKAAEVPPQKFAPSELRESGKVRLCIWNLKLYLDTYKMTERGRTKAPKSETEKRAILEVLKDINPDVLGIEEIGTDKFLKEFLNILREGGLSYPYVAVSDKTDEYPHCAILSKLEFKSTSILGDDFFDYFGKISRSPRALILAEFETENTRWFFGSLHLKSRFGARKRDGNFSKFRTLECEKIAEDLKKILESNYPVIIGGDFNDEPKDRSTTPLKNAGLSVVETENKIPTYVWEKKNIPYTFDFFMASKSMLKLIESPRIFPTSKGGSDHLPVYCDLNFSRN